MVNNNVEVKYYIKDKNGNKVYITVSNEEGLLKRIEENKMIINNHYLMKIDDENHIFKYQGEINNEDEVNEDEFNDDEEIMFYLKPEKAFIYITNEKKTDVKYYKEEVPKSNLSSILNNIKSNKDLISKAKLNTNKKTTTTSSKPRKTNQPRKTSVNGRIKRDEILNININDEDSELVRIIKEIVNNNHITLNFIYSKHKKEDESDAYNKFYGLISRSEMSWNIFKSWLAMFDLGFEIRIFSLHSKDKNKK
jgi:hypothetical protein